MIWVFRKKCYMLLTYHCVISLGNMLPLTWVGYNREELPYLFASKKCYFNSMSNRIPWKYWTVYNVNTSLSNLLIKINLRYISFGVFLSNGVLRFSLTFQYSPSNILFNLTIYVIEKINHLYVLHAHFI